jgi:hypothetical protein
MPKFIAADAGVYVNLDFVSIIRETDNGDTSTFEFLDARGKKAGQTTRDSDYDLMREFAQVVPALPGQTAFTVSFDPGPLRPAVADVLVEERAVVAWRIVGTRAEPVFADYPYVPEKTFLQTLDGRLRCDVFDEEFASADELRVDALKEVQSFWDREQLNASNVEESSLPQ